MCLISSAYIILHVLSMYVHTLHFYISFTVLLEAVNETICLNIPLFYQLRQKQWINFQQWHRPKHRPKHRLPDQLPERI